MVNDIDYKKKYFKYKNKYFKLKEMEKAFIRKNCPKGKNMKECIKWCKDKGYKLKDLGRCIARVKGIFIADNDTIRDAIYNYINYFEEAKQFYGDINTWDTSKVTHMDRLFENAISFNEDISKWDTSHVIDMNRMFRNAGFNKDISKWDTSQVTNMNSMFYNAGNFNQDISNWDTNRVLNMGFMFCEAVNFNQDINTKEVTVNGRTYVAWETAYVKTMAGMFSNAIKFNGNISDWNTSHVTHIGFMFSNALEFNGDINTKLLLFSETQVRASYVAWSTSGVRRMIGTFSGARKFNQDISKWDTIRVLDMRLMFANAVKFNQDISKWQTDNILLQIDGMPGMNGLSGMFLDATSMKEKNKPISDRLMVRGKNCQVVTDFNTCKQPNPITLENIPKEGTKENNYYKFLDDIDEEGNTTCIQVNHWNEMINNMGQSAQVNPLTKKPSMCVGGQPFPEEN